MSGVFTANKKLLKKSAPTEIEESVAQAIFDLEANSTDWQSVLQDLYITSARELTVSADKKAILIFVPFKLLTNFQIIQPRLVRELEKKFNGKHVIMVAQRRILKKPSRNNRVKQQKRPMSRTLTSVHSAILDDVCYPTEIVGKRTRYRLDGSKVMRVYLNRRDQANSEHKIETFSAVYKQLTGKEVTFEFDE